MNFLGSASKLSKKSILRDLNLSVSGVHRIEALTSLLTVSKKGKPPSYEGKIRYD